MCICRVNVDWGTVGTSMSTEVLILIFCKLIAGAFTISAHAANIVCLDHHWPRALPQETRRWKIHLSNILCPYVSRLDVFHTTTCYTQVNCAHNKWFNWKVFQILILWMNWKIAWYYCSIFLRCRSFTENISAQLFYFIKCIYFGLSAIQIRSAYPARILGNFLTRNYDYYNLFLFKG